MSVSINNSMNSRAMQGSDFRNANIGSVAEGLEKTRSNNNESAKVLTSALESFKNGEITSKEMLETFDKLKKSGAKGPAMDQMEKLFHQGSDARKIINEDGNAAFGFTNSMNEAKLSGWVDEALEKMPNTPEADSNSKPFSADAVSSLMGFGF